MGFTRCQVRERRRRTTKERKAEQKRAEGAGEGGKQRSGRDRKDEKNTEDPRGGPQWKTDIMEALDVPAYVWRCIPVAG